MKYGPITSVEDHGTVWLVEYRVRAGGRRSVYFDHRPFSSFYEGVTGRDFFQDYRFGSGAQFIARQLQGRRIGVDDDQGVPTVVVED